MKPISKKVVMVAVPVALIAAFAVAMRPSPLQVDLGAVTRGPLRVTLDEEGETRVRERFVVSAPAAGRVLRIEMEPGEPVRAGVTVLSTLRPVSPDLLDLRSRASLEARVRSAESALGQARADLARSRAGLRFAQADFDRRRKLGQEGIVSRETVELAELSLETSRGEVAAARFAAETAAHDLEAARASLLESSSDSAGGVLEVRSPVDGVVLRRLRESEAAVLAGEPLLEVGDPRDLEIVSDLLSTDAAQLRQGQPVEIEQWGGSAALAGRVRRIEPSGFTKISALGVEEQRVNTMIDLADPPARWPGLGDGFRVEVKVVLWQQKDVLQVPASSLFRDAEGWAVFTVENGKARRRRIEAGKQNGLQAEIVSGLREGERVIVHPSADVQDGGAVEERTGK